MAEPKIDPNTRALVEAIGLAIRENRPQGPYDKAGFSPEKIAELTEWPKPKKYRKVACKSDETGATFTAVVGESRTHAAGRILTLEDYTHPDGVAEYRSAGGLVPDGMGILHAGTSAPTPGAKIAKHDLTPQYLQWRYTEFWQKDLRRFAGAALARHHAVDEAAWSTPWLDGRVGALES